MECGELLCGRKHPVKLLGSDCMLFKASISQ